MRSSTVDGPIRDVLESNARLQHGLSISALSSARREIKTIAKSDYAAPLRKAFHRSQIKELIREARRFVWPNLNHEPLKIDSPREFVERYGDLGVQVKFAKPSARELDGLLGFYVRENPGLKRPLIWINVAKHRVVMSAAFAHEMGHHLSSRIFGARGEDLHFLYMRYADHLRQAPEMAADLFVSLGCLPRHVVAGFSGPSRNRSATNNEKPSPLRYFQDQYQIRFDGSMSPTDEVQCLAGMLHYTKLRQAILTEFDI
jgi:hypothetical protein